MVEQVGVIAPFQHSYFPELLESFLSYSLATRSMVHSSILVLPESTLESQACPRPGKSELHLNKIPRWFISTLKFASQQWFSSFNVHQIHFWKHKFPVSDSVNLGWESRISTANMFPVDVYGPRWHGHHSMSHCSILYERIYRILT